MNYFPGFTLVFEPRAGDSMRRGQISPLDKEVDDLTGPANSLRYAGLVEAKAVRNLVPHSIPNIPNLGNAPSTPAHELRRIFPSMHEALAMYNRVKVEGYRDTASFILCFPAAGVKIDGEYEGMPAQEAIAYATPLPGRDFSLMAGDIRAAINNNLKRDEKNRAVASTKLRVSLHAMVSTRERDNAGPTAMSIPLARVGTAEHPELVETPLMWKPPNTDGGDRAGLPVRSIIDNTQQDMLIWGEEVARSFLAFAESELPNGKSGRELNTLIIVYVWGVRYFGTRSRSSSRVRTTFPPMRVGGRKVREGPRLTEDSYLSAQVFASRGLAMQPAELDGDNLCFPRAFMIAMDPLVLSRSTSYLPELLALCYEELYARVERLPLSAIKTAGVAKLQEISTLRRTISREYASRGLHLRQKAAGYNGKYALRNRMTSIECNLAAALSGDHPMYNLRGIARPFLLSEANVDAFRKRIPPTTALQVWTVGGKGRPFLRYPDPRATMPFLIAGGLVANIFVGSGAIDEGHAGAITSLAECCNHTDSLDRRIFCPLCGISFSRISRGINSPLFEHLKRNCQVPDERFSVPLSPSNMRRMPGIAYPAVRRIPLAASLAVTFDKVLSGTTVTYRISEASLVARAVVSADVDHEDITHTWRAFPTRYWRTSIQEWLDWRHFYDPLTVETDRSADLTVAPSTPSREVFNSLSGVHALRDIFLEQLSKPVVDHILEQIKYKGPADSVHFRALREGRLRESRVCAGCYMPLVEPSVWKQEEAFRKQSAAEDTTEAAAAAATEKSTPEDEEDPEDTLLFERDEDTDCCSEDEPVGCMKKEGEGDIRAMNALYEWHCGATGTGGIAHAECAKYIGFRGTSFIIEVADEPSMAACVDILFREQFYRERCWQGKPPKLCMGETGIRRIEMTLIGSKPANKFTVLPVVLRVRSSFFDHGVTGNSALERATDNLDDFLIFSEHMYAIHGIWPLALQTGISYSRLVLMRNSQHLLPHGQGVTSITSAEVLSNVEDMVQGGLILLGEKTYWPPLENPLDRRCMRLLFDATAAYPVQMIRWKLPWRCHADSKLPELCFEGRLEEGKAYISRTDLDGPYTERVEVSGAFPPETHAFLARFPPVWQSINVSACMFTSAQRKKLNMPSTESLGMRSVGHFFPVERLTIFMRTAKIWQGLGFEFTLVGQVRQTPAFAWAREFAEGGERARRLAANELLLAKRRGEHNKLAERQVKAVKTIFNSTVGSLNRNMGRWTEFKTRTPPKSVEEEALADVRYASHERCIPRTIDAGDCTLDQYKTAAKLHRELPLVALFIQEMARDDMIEFFYGSRSIIPERRPFEGLVNTFPDARVLYGCTDSIAVQLQVEHGDVRRVLQSKHEDEIDFSNVESAAWRESWLAPLTASKAGQWGLFKEETGFAGLDEVGVHRPNGWAYSVVQSEGETLPQHKGAGGHILKGIPKSWQDAGFTVADWRAGVVPKDAPPVLIKEPTTDVGSPALRTVNKTVISSFSNRGCVCECEGSWRQLPLGAKCPWPKDT